ncbi:MAG: hypothetical protein JWM44_4108 [Bacilli bacterium]|nr:hypothetical protein [Bacilli bacterium]
MSMLRIGEKCFDVEVVVFDKDGLLFDSQHFWKYLAEARIKKLLQMDGFPVDEWCSTFGIHYQENNVIRVEPQGIFALAPPQEEIIVTASLMCKYLSLDWGKCRDLAKKVFDDSDEAFDLLGALLPKAGFPDIFKKLKAASIPYGIATSDDYARTKMSISAYDCFEDLNFIVTPLNVKLGKPNPDMLHLIAEKMRVPLEKIMMIGDSFVDVMMANLAGCIGIGIPDDSEMKHIMEPYATCIIDSLEEIEVVEEVYTNGCENAEQSG